MKLISLFSLAAVRSAYTDQGYDQGKVELLSADATKSYEVTYKNKTMYISPYGVIFNAHDVDLATTTVDQAMNDGSDNGFIGNLYRDPSNPETYLKFSVSKEKIADFKVLKDMNKQMGDDANRLIKLYKYHFQNLEHNLNFNLMIGISKDWNVYYINKVNNPNQACHRVVFEFEITQHGFFRQIPK